MTKPYTYGMGKYELGHAGLKKWRETMFKRIVASLIAAAALGFVAGPATAGSTTAGSAKILQHKGAIEPGLVLPRMNAARGRLLFASKGCVVCHSVNGIGGTDAPEFDAKNMSPAMDPFNFVARMWRGAGPMIAMQNEELGAQIEFTGQQLADIIAFLHNAKEQKKFSKRDIPANILSHIK